MGAKTRRFPTIKREKGQRGNVQVDVALVREMYVSGPNYRWSDFCKENNFPSCSSSSNAWFRESVDWPAWKREWVRRKNVVAEEDITPKMMDCSKIISEGRIKYVQTWSAIAANMKALLTHLMNEHIKNAAADQHPDFATQVVGQKRLKLDIDQLNQFAAAGNRIAELEARAFMIVAGDKNRVSHELEAAETEDKDSVPEFQIVPIGQTMAAHERTKMIADYFDQFQAKPAEPAPALPAPAESSDAED